MCVGAFLFVFLEEESHRIDACARSHQADIKQTHTHCIYEPVPGAGSAGTVVTVALREGLGLVVCVLCVCVCKCDG